MIRPVVAFCAVFFAATCASEPPPPLLAARRSSVRAIEDEPPPAPDAAAATDAPAEPPPSAPADAVATKLGVEKAALVWSAGKKSFAVVLPANAKRAKARRPPPTIIAVYSAKGEPSGEFRALGVGAISELRFLGEDRLFYRLPVKPSAAHKARRRPSRSASALPPPLRYALQPIKPEAAPIACTGWRFVFSPAGDHVAHVGGDDQHQRVFVDGVAVYPRRGATTLQGDPAWAADSLGLAAIETGARHRLVVLVEFDNPTGDNTWPLPPEASDPALRVFWAGSGKLVVGPSLTKPVFAASFHRDAPTTAERK